MARRFGRAVPYLLKILDVRAMLSIQAHPDAPQAAEAPAAPGRLFALRDVNGRAYTLSGLPGTRPVLLVHGAFT